MTAASVAVMVPQGVFRPISWSAFQWQPAGSLMMPSVTPSRASHALMTAVVNASSLQVGRASCISFMTRAGQISAGMNRVQLMAGAPETMPL